MKNVLVLMHDDPGQEARFQAALDITRALDGHLSCIDVSVAPIIAADLAMASAEALLMADEQLRERANRSHMETRLKAEGVPYDWTDEAGFLGSAVCDSAKLADIIVLNRALDTVEVPDMRELVGEVLLASGKPIVAVPETARGFNVFGPALIAWDGSREAVAALRAATPLLARAASVTILEVRDGSVRLPAEDGAEYLSRHGIRPLIRRESSMIDLPSTMILEAIETTGAAWLVMGGFGHSRFIEGVFGGVTRRLLKESPVALFLAH